MCKFGFQNHWSQRLKPWKKCLKPRFWLVHEICTHSYICTCMHFIIAHSTQVWLHFWWSGWFSSLAFTHTHMCLWCTYHALGHYTSSILVEFNPQHWVVLFFYLWYGSIQRNCNHSWKFTEIEWLLCVSFLALLALFLPLVITALFCVIDSWEVYMCVSQKSQTWDRGLRPGNGRQEKSSN